MTHRNIVLVGYRGTGKTTVGRLLAAKLGWTFADADEAVEAAAGKTITDIFATEGEASFRDREAAALAELCARSGHVIATGGGAILRETNRAALAAGGFVAWLVAAPETVWGRIQGDPTTQARRPNLTSLGGADEVRALVAARESLYRAVADFAVASDALSPGEIADAIITSWNGGSTCRSSTGPCASSPSG
ncbi:MAG: shikimate kinase [Gemmata sp.]